MSDKPKVGDRVRVTFEATYKGPGDKYWPTAGLVENGDGLMALRTVLPVHATIEVLSPPEPPEVTRVRDEWSDPGEYTLAAEARGVGGSIRGHRRAESVEALIAAYSALLAERRVER